MPEFPISAALPSVPGKAAASANVSADPAEPGMPRQSDAAGFSEVLENHVQSLATAIKPQPALPLVVDDKLPDLNADMSALQAILDASSSSAMLAAPMAVVPQTLSPSLVPLRGGAETALIGLTQTDQVATASIKNGLIGKAAEFAGDGKTLPLVATESPFQNALKDLTSQQSQGLTTGTPFTAVTAPVTPNVQASATPTLTLQPPVGTPSWDGALGQKVTWMASNQMQIAELHLNPPNLGPLEVRLTVTNDQASAMFVSHHAGVRDAIESALPRLREMLAESGITLGNVSVGSQSFQQQHAFDQQGGRFSAQPGALAVNGVSDAFTQLPQLARGHMGMVDTFV